MVELKRSSELFGKRRTALIYAPAKSGKTIAAATMSEKCPKDLPAPELIFLDDVIFLQADSDGIESLYKLNLDAPVLDISTPEMEDPSIWGSEAGAQKILSRKKGDLTKAMKMIAKEVMAGRCKTVILDTLTTFLSDYVSLYQTIYPSKQQSGMLYNNVLIMSTKVAQPLRLMGCNLICTAHAKALPEAMVSDQAEKDKILTKQKAVLMPGANLITPHIVGQSKAYWEGALSNVWPLEMVRAGAKVKGVFVRPYGGAGWEGGSRYHGLDAKEPAHLRRLFEKATQKQGESK